MALTIKVLMSKLTRSMKSWEATLPKASDSYALLESKFKCSELYPPKLERFLSSCYKHIYPLLQFFWITTTQATHYCSLLESSYQLEISKIFSNITHYVFKYIYWIHACSMVHPTQRTPPQLYATTTTPKLLAYHHSQHTSPLYPHNWKPPMTHTVDN